MVYCSRYHTGPIEVADRSLQPQLHKYKIPHHNVTIVCFFLFVVVAAVCCLPFFCPCFHCNYSSATFYISFIVSVSLSVSPFLNALTQLVPAFYLIRPSSFLFIHSPTHSFIHSIHHKNNNHPTSSSFSPWYVLNSFFCPLPCALSSVVYLLYTVLVFTPRVYVEVHSDVPTILFSVHEDLCDLFPSFPFLPLQTNKEREMDRFFCVRSIFIFAPPHLLVPTPSRPLSPSRNSPFEQPSFSLPSPIPNPG